MKVWRDFVPSIHHSVFGIFLGSQSSEGPKSDAVDAPFSALDEHRACSANI